MVLVHHDACLSGEEIIKRRLWMRKVGQVGESCHALRHEPSLHVQDALAERMVICDASWAREIYRT